LGDVIVTEILPVRPHLDVYPKLRFCKQKYDTPFKRLIQIKQLAFFLWPWEKEFNCLKKIHDTYLQKNWPKMKDTIVTPELKQDFDLWFGFIKANSVMLQVFPDRYDVRAFFFHKKKELNSSSDLRTKILETPYRAFKFVHWDLIHDNKYVLPIGGVYPDNRDLRERQAIDDKRRSFGLPVVPQKRGVVPPRRAHVRS